MIGTGPRYVANNITGDMLSIRAAAQICRQNLQECASRAPLREGHWAANRSSDFNLWIAGVDACAHESKSLDKRLEGNRSAQKVVIGTLSTLAAWTRKCKELARGINPTSSTNEQNIDSITLEEAKNAVETLLKTLVGLELAIRKASTAARMRRADRTFYKRKDNYQELSETLESTLRALGHFSNDKNSTSEAPAPAGIDKKAAKISQVNLKYRLDQLQVKHAPLRFEQQAIILANVKRHDRFEFYRNRQKQLVSAHAQEPAQAPHVEVRSSGAHSSDPPPESEEQALQSSQTVSNKEPAPTAPQHSTSTTDKASDDISSLILVEPVEMVSSVVAATTITRRADYPNPPKDKTRCPYCLIPLKGEADNVLQWKKHASEDLQPYTCYLPDCPLNNPFFNTFSLWKTHVLSKQHQKLEGWTCLFCRFSSELTEESIFRGHIQNDHSNAIAEDFSESYTKMCCRYTVPALDRCPVCSIYENDWKLQKDSNPIFEPNIKSYLEHLGQCLHDFALMVLPSAEHTNTMDDASQNLSAVSQITDRSLSSCSLHISNNMEAGLTQTDLERSLGFTDYDKVDKDEEIQAWLEFLDKTDDPNPLGETMVLGSQGKYEEAQALVRYKLSETEFTPSKADLSTHKSMNHPANFQQRQLIYSKTEYSRNPSIALQTIALMSDKRKEQLLLDKGANIVTHGGDDPQGASSKSYHDILRMLLDKGADPNTQYGDRGNFLQVASSRGDQKIVRLLIEYGADVNARGGWYDTALQAASWQSDQEMIRLLLGRGADIDAEGGRCGTALQAASSQGNQDIVRSLIEHGADTNAQGGRYGTALQAASSKGYQDIVQLLVDEGADINVRGGRYGTALQAASYKGYQDIVQLLLNEGAYINVQRGRYGTALQAASCKGYKDIVQLLLDKGADINVRGGRYGTPFQAASYKGYKEIVQLLLDKDAEIDALGGRYSNALQAASYKSYKDIVQLPLDKVTDVDALREQYGSALPAASSEDHQEDVVQLPLKYGATKFSFEKTDEN